MPRVVILGTGTGIGKTYFTMALARELIRALPKAKVVAVKPIETGTHASRSGVPSADSDAGALERATGDTARRPHPRFAFGDPVSPHLAARRAGRRISIGQVVEWLHVPLYDNIWQLVETAGGVFSPLSRTQTNADLAKALDPAIWILVAPDALGVLHDVRATTIALRQTARAPDFLVLTASKPPDASTGTNAAELARIGLPRPIVVLERGVTPGRALSKLVRALLRRQR